MPADTRGTGAEAGVKLGLQVPDFTFPSGPDTIASELAGIARRSEDAGLSSFWVMDHYFQIGMVGPEEREMLEGWTTLGFIAGITTTLLLGTMVTGVTYRHPGLLVKIATTLDVLSKGRAYLGIGAAWNESEHLGLGVPFPPIAERFGRLEETLQIAHQMWKGDETPFEGTYYHLERPLNSPQPVRRPHPPILIGGAGEKKTLRLVAKYADACNIFGMRGLPFVEEKLAVLARHCEEIGRPYGDIEKTALIHADLSNASASPEELVHEIGSLAELGISHVIMSLKDVSDERPFEILRDGVVPKLRTMVPSPAGK